MVLVRGARGGGEWRSTRGHGPGKFSRAFQLLDAPALNNFRRGHVSSSVIGLVRVYSFWVLLVK